MNIKYILVEQPYKFDQYIRLNPSYIYDDIKDIVYKPDLNIAEASIYAITPIRNDALNVESNKIKLIMIGRSKSDDYTFLVNPDGKNMRFSKSEEYPDLVLIKNYLSERFKDTFYEIYACVLIKNLIPKV